MSEISDRVKHKIIIATQKLMQANEAFERGDISWEETALYTQAFPEEILSIPKLAIVDREAELPLHNYNLKSVDRVKAYLKAQLDMLKASWVKEIKD